MRFISVITVVLTGMMMFSSLYGAELHEGQKIKIIKKGPHFRLGVVVKSLDPEKLKDLKLKGGAEIVKVLPNSVAEETGLKKEDVITKFDGKDINEASTLHSLITEIEEQKEVELEIMREGKKVKLKAMLKPQEEDEDFLVHLNKDEFDLQLEELEELKEIPRIIKKKIKMIGQKGGFLGIKGSSLNDQLKTYFEVDNGVLVEEVIKETPADSVGLLAGDIITAVEDKKIEDYEDLIRALNYHDPGETVNIKYSRKGKSKVVKVTLKAKQFGSHHGFKWMGDGDEEIIIDHLPEFHFNHEHMEELEEELEDMKIDIDIYFI